MAEREGFEPSVVFSYARFPGVCLKPLSHLSTTRECNVKERTPACNGFLESPQPAGATFGSWHLHDHFSEARRVGSGRRITNDHPFPLGVDRGHGGRLS